ncbi:DUF7249 family protein [Miltoncostaea marina]|uniref:DUF7249 family protein n=1 Tax=Miltoncostaea marina TaxID=2843215 RepID=UPI001C3D5A38|nr:hypothetical protein [Miltoncostaea marina]
MSTADEYNGWTNRETWAVALHLSNDEGMYEAARAVLGSVASERAAADTLEDWTRSLFEERGADARTLLLMALDIGSLWRVNWREVAASLVNA